MALPDSRNTTYAPLSQVASADLNDLQDSIARRSHGPVTVLIQASAMEGEAAPNTAWRITPYTHWALAPGSEFVAVPLCLPPLLGADISEIVCYGTVDASSGATLGASARLAAASFETDTDTVGDITKTGPVAAGNFTITFDTSDALLPFTVGPATEHLYLELGPGDGGARIWNWRGVAVTFRQPIVPAP